VIKSRGKKWAKKRHVACTWEIINAYKIVVGKLEVTRPFERHSYV
jgi:hypothetical protein